MKLLYATVFTHLSIDGLHFCDQGNKEDNADKDLDESREFFELVQQFMAEYTASAKVSFKNKFVFDGD